MATLKSPTDPFIITPEQKNKYEIQFKKLCPTGDFISGQQARELMLQSKLSPQILAHVWHLADVDADGRMDINEFSIALHLIALKLKGFELPPVLPHSLKVLVEPPPFVAFENSQPTATTATATPLKTAAAAPVMSPTSSSVQQIRQPPINKMQSSPSPATISSSVTTTASNEWSIPQSIKLKYTQIFNSHDRQRTGFLTGIQARNILLESKLSQAILAQIWNLSDIDTDGRLTCEEFVLAMYLVDKAKRAEPLPAKLPADLIPPSYRRNSLSGSGVGVAGTMSHSSSADDPLSDHTESSTMAKHSFEDKRRENYEKGQAELDRRRAALQEQERRAREERERKEREENMRKEKERQEMERRKQEELEAQRQKLLQQELEREEQKRRQQEVRELARKEMERQRQREMEQTQRTELLTKRARLMEELQRIKSRRKVLILEHEQIDKQLADKRTAAQKSRDAVLRIKTEIDGMRIRKDQIVARQTQIKQQMKTMTEKQLLIEQEKVRLASQLKSLIVSAPAMTNGDANSNSNVEQQLGTSFGSILQTKQSQIKQLRSQLERIKNDYDLKKQDIQTNKQELQRLKSRYQEQRQKALKFAEQLELKRQEAEKVRDGKSTSKYAADSDIAWGQEVPTNFEWPSSAAAAAAPSQQQQSSTTTAIESQNHSNDNTTTAAAAATTTTTRTKFRYRCIFEFEARNVDEISIKPGEYIMVDTSACSEEGWLSGENSAGKIGWFPKDYAVLDDDVDVVASNDTVNQSSAVAPAAAAVEPTLAQNDQSEAPATAAAATIRDAIALYDWQTNEEGHLSFHKDDRLRIHQQQDSWLFGDLLDSQTGAVKQSGWIPESYVMFLDGDTAAAIQPQQQQQPAPSQYYVSLFAFDTQEPGDLGFDVNELIKVEKQDGDWWTGVIVDRQTGQEINERRGIFPSNFVGPATAADIPKSNETNASNAVTANAAAAPAAATAADNTSGAKVHHQPLDRKESESICDSPKSTKKSKSKAKQEIVQAVAAYQATGPEQLSLDVGQLIQVRKKTPTGWWEGELQAKGKKKQVGWFPASYVKPFGGGAVAAAGAAVANQSTVAAASKDSKNPNDEVEIERVQALYQFNAQRDDEISFEKDDIIRVLAKTDPTWWRGHNTRTNAVGLFPSNHVQVLPSSSAADNSGKDSKTSTIDSYNHGYQRNSLSAMNHVNNYDDSFEDDTDEDESIDNDDDTGQFDGWGDDFDDDDDHEDGSINDEVGSVISGGEAIGHRLTNTELRNSNESHGQTAAIVDDNRRQNLILEFINTEHDYINDLYFVIENYMKRIRQSKLITMDDFELIFNNIEDIYEVNRSFYDELNERLKQSNHGSEFVFFDIIYEYLNRMQKCYETNFANQLRSSNCLQHSLETNHRFNDLLKQISRETRTHLPLSSYLIKPMQRITKYPLLIEKLRKETNENHPDHTNCVRSLELSKQILRDLNEYCKQLDNVDKLDWLQQNVCLRTKQFQYDLNLNSETQFLGPRQLIHSGVLIKSPSSKLLIGFLFNDFFMLIKPDTTSATTAKQLRNVRNFFQSQVALQTRYTIYRRPILLDRFQLTDYVNFEQQLSPTLFRLFLKHEKRFLNLRTKTIEDCDKWLNELYRQQQTYINLQSKFKRSNHLTPPPSSMTSQSSNPIGNLFITIIEIGSIYTNNLLDLQLQLSIGNNESNSMLMVKHTPIVQCCPSAKQSPSSPKQLSSLHRTSSMNALSHNNNVKRDQNFKSLSSMFITRTTTNGPYRFTINYDTKFLLFPPLRDHFLVLRLYDMNPFQPIRCLGERRLSLQQLCDDSIGLHGSYRQEVQLHALKSPDYDNDNYCCPMILMKYKFLINNP